MREVRHLPPWMLQKVSASHVNSENVGENHSCTEKGALARVPELKANTGNALSKQTRADRKGKTSGRKLHKRRRFFSKKDGRQKGNKKEGSSADRVQNSSVNESQNVEHHSYSCDKYPVQPLRDEEMELTVEDLMAIAEEYVNYYKQQQQQEVPARQCMPEKHNPKSSESGSSLDSPCKNNRSSAPAKEALYNSTLRTTSTVISTSTCLALDPAQDMLDLLLGPLLKKPFEDKKNESVTEDLAFNYEVSRQNQGNEEKMQFETQGGYLS